MGAPSTNPQLRKRVLAALASVGVVAALGVGLDHFEGASRTAAFRDMGGVWTLCRGITHGVHAGQVATVEQCHAMDQAEAVATVAAVDAGFVRKQPDARRFAFADFAYNVGQGAFMASTARRLINRGQIREGCDQLSRWVYVEHRVIQWQVKRRAFEREFCLMGLPQ